MIECYIYEESAPFTVEEARRVKARGGITGKSTSDLWPQLPDNIPDLDIRIAGAWVEQCIASVAYEALASGATVEVDLQRSVASKEGEVPFNTGRKREILLQEFGDILQPYIDQGKLTIIPEE